MGRKRKRDPKDPTTSMDPVSPKEAKAAEETFDKGQQTEIANLMDDAPDNDLPDPDRTNRQEPEDKPSEEPAETQEQESTPEAKDSLKADEAKAEEQPPEEPEIEVDVPESEPQTEETPAPDSETESVSEYVTGEKFSNYTVEVVTEDGAKQVPMENLVTTYQQFPNIQRKYQDLKPVMDLAEKAQVNVRDVMPLLELGIETYAKQQGIVQGTQPPVDGSVHPQSVQPSGIPGQYQGPFKDAETDEYYKEADPDLYASMHTNFAMAQNAVSKMSSIENEINRIRTERQAPPGPSAEETNRAFDGKIKNWSGDHTDYFSAPNIGETRLNAFKNFIIKSHANSGLKIRDLTSEFLQAEFARFDPKYNLSYMQKLAAKKANAAKDDSGMFAEGSGARTQAAPLDEQQGYMEDML
jgi:hypothetical protein